MMEESPTHSDVRGTDPVSRRAWLRSSAALLGGAAAAVAMQDRPAVADNSDRALIAITLDLEMSRNFPTWESTHWDYEKGNLNAQTKQYAVEAARRVKAAGGLLHFFAVGQVFEQEDISWAKELVSAGHPIGNHTYDHVNVTATKPEDIQFRFQRAPWLIRDQTVSEVIRENIRLCDLAMRQRLGKTSDGFRTPGGFRRGLTDHPQIRAMLLELGFSWVSSLYPPHANTDPMVQPGMQVIDSIVAAQRMAQPFTYPDGLVEIPMSPISDIGAFRTGRWKLESFLTAVRESVQWAIEHRAVFDFLGHPSCLYVVDPEFKTIDLICDLVAQAGSRAAIVSLDEIHDRMAP